MQSNRTWMNSRLPLGNMPVNLRLFRYSVLNLLALTFFFVGRCALAQATGSIQGKVTDSSGAPLLGAVVAIQGADGNPHVTVTDVEGAFQIASLPSGNYDVKISASGMSDWTASSVAASTTSEAPLLLAVLAVAPNVTTVTVGLSKEELAEEQLKDEVHQRVLGVIPNYYVAYGNATPLSARQKFHLSFKTLIDPATFAAVGITAGIQQSKNSYYQFGQGSEGFAKRYGAAYGTTATNLLITSAAAESVLHQDPRYFYSGTGTKAHRAWYAVKSAFRTKGDNGTWEPPYAGVLGAIGAAEISDLYYPGSRTQYTLIGRSLMFHFAGLVGLNLAEEFLLKKVTTQTPKSESASNSPVLHEGTPITLIAVEGFDAQAPAVGQTVLFVLAQELTQSGTVLAATGDVASGLVVQVNAGSAPGGGGVIALQDVKLRAGSVDVPLRTNQARGAATSVQYQVLPGSGKVEVKLFVAADVEFPEKE